MFRVCQFAVAVSAALLLASSASAQTATKLDLVCTGTAKDSKGGQTSNERQFTKRFRVDLDTGMWCEGTCAEIVPVASVTPGKLGLYNYNSRMVEHFINVNRQTGG